MTLVDSSTRKEDGNSRVPRDSKNMLYFPGLPWLALAKLIHVYPSLSLLVLLESNCIVNTWYLSALSLPAKTRNFCSYRTWRNRYLFRNEAQEELKDTFKKFFL